MRLYRYDEVPLKYLGLDRKRKLSTMQNTVCNVLKYIIRYNFFNLSDPELINMFYSSKTYKKIIDFKTGWYTKDYDELYSLFIAEKTGNNTVWQDLGYDEMLYRYKCRYYRA